MITRESTPAADRVTTWLSWVLLVLAFAGHAWLTSRFTQGSRIGEPRAFAYGDYALHFNDAMRASRAWREVGSLWAWDPQFMAGYPAGVFEAVSNRPAEMLLALAPGAPEVWFKGWVVLTILLTPLLPWLSLKLLDRTLSDSPSSSPQLAAVLAIAFMHLDTRLFTFLRRGLFQFPFAAALASVAMAALWWLAVRPGLGTAAVAGAAVGVTLFCHPTTVVILLPATVAVVVATRGRRIVDYGVVAALGILPNLLWLDGVARNLRYLGQDSGFWGTGEQSLVVDLLAEPGSAFRNALVCAALVAVWWSRDRGIRLAAVTALMCVVIGYAGSRIPLVDRLEPARFVLAAALVATIPAATLLSTAIADRRARRLAGLCVLVGLTPLVLGRLVYGRVVDPLPSFLSFTLPLEETPDADALVAAVQARTDRSARVLIDQDWPGSHHRGFIGGYVGARVDRELLGGPHPWVKLRHNHANASAGHFIGRRLADLDDNELMTTFTLYNVGWAATRDPELRKRLAAWRDARSVGRAGTWELFRFAIDRSFVQAGAVDVVRAGLNRVALRPSTVETIVLKYHWQPGMRASGSARVAPRQVDGAPLPFIEISGHGGRPVTIEVR